MLKIHSTIHLKGTYNVSASVEAEQYSSMWLELSDNFLGAVGRLLSADEDRQSNVFYTPPKKTPILILYVKQT